MMRLRNMLIITASLLGGALMAGCGNGPAGTADQSGYIRFSLQWPSPFASKVLPELRGAMFAPSGDVCQDYQIQNINVSIYTAANALVTSQTFSCSAHMGFVAVAPGSYNIMVDGTTTFGGDDWRGQKTGITVNVGTTAEAGAVAMSYIGTDNVKPTIVSTTPTNGSSSVPLSNAVTAVFSEDMAACTIDTSTFLVTRGTIAVLGTVSYASASKTASFLPSTPLSNGTVYTATITTDAKDMAMNALASKTTWTFTTVASVSGGGGSSLWDSLIWDTDVWN